MFSIRKPQRTARGQGNSASTCPVRSFPTKMLVPMPSCEYFKVSRYRVASLFPCFPCLSPANIQEDNDLYTVARILPIFPMPVSQRSHPRINVRQRRGKHSFPHRSIGGGGKALLSHLTGTFLCLLILSAFSLLSRNFRNLSSFCTYSL